MNKIASIVLGVLGILYGISALSGVILASSPNRIIIGSALLLMGIGWSYRSYKLFKRV